VRLFFLGKKIHWAQTRFCKFSYGCLLVQFINITNMKEKEEETTSGP
jgi:hypothetical protein